MNLDSMKLKNSFRILELLMKNEMSRVDLARETGLTKTTVGGIVKSFMDLGFLREKRFISSGIGRPSVLLEIIPKSVHVMGLGLGRYRVTGCLIDALGHLISQKFRSFNKNDFKSIMKALFEVSDELFAEASKKFITVDAMAIGAPAPLDTNEGIVKNPPKFSGFENVPIVKLMSEKYGVNTWLENDVDMVALGEKWYGEGRTLDDFVYVQVNEGIGAGIIINGELYRGKEGYTGEIGHFLVHKGKEYKYLEDLYGVDVIIRRAKEEISDEVSSIQDIGSLIDLGNKKAKKLASEAGQVIGTAILSMIHTLGISDIFIGGSIRGLGEVFLLSVQKVVNEHVFSKSEVNIRYSNVEETAAAIGAAAHGIKMYLEKLITENV